MNILFYTSYEVSPIKGGTERITATLSTSLLRQYNVNCYSVYKTPIPIEFERTCFVESRQILNGASFEKDLYEFIKRNNIDIVVNQGAFELAFPIRCVLNRFKNKYLITVHHFNPGAEEHFLNLHNIVWKLKKRQATLKNTLKLLSYPLLKYWKKRNLSKAYREAYLHSDRIVLLSDNFREDFRLYAHLRDTDKLRCIHNALSFNSFFNMENYKDKKKEVLVVSRLDEVQKRISLVLKIWKRIEQQPSLNEWRLTIVGHGEEYENIYKEFLKKENLKRVTFVGAQKPESYYKRASVFLLTSAYEGWGLTLTEAQQFGVVPLAFNSYASLTDIITDGENGFIIPDNELELYTEKLMMLMQNDSLREKMAYDAIKSSKRFDINKICTDWINLFYELTATA